MKSKIYSLTLSERKEVFSDENIITFSFLVAIKSKRNREIIAAKLFEVCSNGVDALYEPFIKITPMKYSRRIFPDRPIGLFIKIEHLESIFNPEKRQYTVSDKNKNIINKSIFTKIIEDLMKEIFEILIQAENYLAIKEKFIIDLMKEGVTNKSTEFLSIFTDSLYRNNFISSSDVLLLEGKSSI